MRARTRRRMPLLLGLLVLATLLPQAAHAAIISVACTGMPTDIDDVQDAIDAAANGDTVQISGICDFALAAPHDGTNTSNPATAVLVRPGAALNGLTIESAPSGQATILGNGLNTAFMIAPGNDNVTIRNLRFANVARAVVTMNNNGTTIGACCATPHPAGLRIIGSPTMDQAILALAVNRSPASAPLGSVIVDYGILGSSTKTYLGQAGASMNGLFIRGNYVTHVAPTPLLADIAGIGVRQIGQRPIDGVSIIRNVVSMEHAQFPLAHVNGIRVDATSPNPAPLTGTIADYFIRNVDISLNILGRLVEVPPVQDIQVAGKTGISVTGVGGFTITLNEVRTIHAVSVLWDAGGGIVVSDSAIGNIINNKVNPTVALDVGVPEGETTDFGGIGVFDEVDTLYGGPLKPQPTFNIFVSGNEVGVSPPFPLALAGRGFVVAAATNVNVIGNRTATTLLDALNIAPILEGPSGMLASSAVFNSTFCGNIWDPPPAMDDPNEVTFGTGSGWGASSGNSFPGAVPPNNSPCVGGTAPTLIFVPTDNTPPVVSEQGPTSDCESARLSQRPIANVTVTMTTDAQTTPLTPSRTFTPDNWNVHQFFCATAVDDAVVEGTHFSIITFSFTSTDPLFAVAPPVQRIWTVLDNDFGLVSILFPADQLCPGGVSLSEGTGAAPPVSRVYQIVLTQQPPTDVVIQHTADQQLLVNDQSTDSVRFTPLNWNIPQNVRVAAQDDLVREGTPHFGFVTHRSFSDTPMWNNVAIPKLKACITDNDGPGPPGVFSPAPNSCLNDGNVILTGTGEEGATVEVFEGGVLLGSAVVVGGVWTLGPLAFGEGVHVLHLRQIGVDGLVSPQWGTLTFRIDTMAPAAPVITSPAPGAIIVGSSLTVTGTAEPFARVIIQRDGIPIGSTTADGAGNWSVTLNVSAGMFVLTAVAMDCAGNLSPPSAPVPITVIIPAPPTILTPLPGAIVRPAVLVSGTGPSGCTISIIENAIVLRAGIRVGLGGTFSVTIGFARGPHTITAVAVCGTFTSAPSAPRSFIVDDIPPDVSLDMPPFGFIAEIGNPITGLETTGGATDNLGVIAIMVSYTDLLSGSVVEAGLATCTGCPGTNVTWTYTPTMLDIVGAYRIGARSVDIAGNQSRLVTALRVNVEP